MVDVEAIGGDTRNFAQVNCWTSLWVDTRLQHQSVIAGRDGNEFDRGVRIASTSHMTEYNEYVAIYPPPISALLIALMQRVCESDKYLEALIQDLTTSCDHRDVNRHSGYSVIHSRRQGLMTRIQVQDQVQAKDSLAMAQMQRLAGGEGEKGESNVDVAPSKGDPAARNQKDRTVIGATMGPPSRSHTEAGILISLLFWQAHPRVLII
jgi:hypothetical protein